MQLSLISRYCLRNIWQRFDLTIVLISLLWFSLTVVAIHTRPLLPIIETRYTSIAWEMWIHHHYLFPLQNGLPYSDKPPILFWLILAGWHIFGVNEWWPRILPALFAYFDAALLYLVARQLWPNRLDIQRSSFILLLGSIAWVIYANLVLFDLLLSFCILLAIYGLLKAYLSQWHYPWLYYVLGMSLGLLTKGPVIFIFVLIPALLLPLLAVNDHIQWLRYSVYIFLYTLLSIGLALSWAVPAAVAAGSDFARAIFFSQTVGRLIHHQHFIQHSHLKSFGWYFKWLPFYLAPWFLFLPFYTQFAKFKKSGFTPTRRFLCAIIVSIFIVMSIIAGKQIHYLLSLIPFCVLLLADWLNSGLQVTRKSLWLYYAAIFILGLILWLLPLIVHELGYQPSILSLSAKAGSVLMLYAMLLFLWVNCKTVWGAQQCLVISSLLLIGLLHLFLIKNLYPYFDIQPLAQFIHNLQQKGHKVAFSGEYEDQFHFLGRLSVPIISTPSKNILTWVCQHPKDWLLINQVTANHWHIMPRKHFFYQARIVNMVTWSDFQRAGYDVPYCHSVR